MATVPGSALRIDWCNKAQVIALARAMGATCVVVKIPERKNYNIVHYERAITQGYKIVWER